jgi:hypothetical protein
MTRRETLAANGTPDPGRGGWGLPASAIERNVASAAHTMLSDERPCENYNRDACQNYSGGDCGRGPLPGAIPCPGGTPPQPRGGGGYGPGPYPQ